MSSTDALSADVPKQPLPRRSMPAGLLLSAGTILPLACLFLDPVVFNIRLFIVAAQFHEPLLWKWQPFAYAAILLSVTFTAACFIRRRFSPLTSACLAGVFAVSSMLAFLMGCCLLPASLPGLIIGVGIFGFAPFLSALAYYELARDLHQASAAASPLFAWTGLTVGAGAYLAAAVVVHTVIERGYADALTAAATTGDVSVRPYVRVFGEFRLMRAYEKENSEDAQRNLAAVYHAVTGGDVEKRLERFHD